MHYTAYLRRTQEAAASIGGEFISLAGGFYGILMPEEYGQHLVLALDLDGSLGWAVWIEDEQGEKCCDNNCMELGWPAIAQLATVARQAAFRHVCPD